jgi:hypothetical protein
MQKRFETMNESKTTRKILFSSLICILLFLPGCSAATPVKDDRSRIGVTSLKDNWKNIETKALEWHADAYLKSAFLPLYIDNPKPVERSIEAYFLSDSDRLNMLVVRLGNDGTLTKSVSPLIFPSTTPPIKRSNWKIDSVDALAGLLNDKDVEFLVAYPNTQCSQLLLERRTDISSKPLMWRLDVVDCGVSDYTRHEYMDPLTGARITK